MAHSVRQGSNAKVLVPEVVDDFFSRGRNPIPLRPWWKKSSRQFRLKSTEYQIKVKIVKYWHFRPIKTFRERRVTIDSWRKSLSKELSIDILIDEIQWVAKK